MTQAERDLTEAERRDDTRRYYAERIEWALVDDLRYALRLQDEFEMLFDQSYDDWDRERREVR